jgi:hypothetical protein
MKMRTTWMATVLLMGLASCPGSDSQTDGTEPPAPNAEAPAGDAGTDVTADEIDKAAEDAAGEIDESNADAELEKLEGELDDGE